MTWRFPLCRRNEGLVALLFTFKLQKLIVATGISIRKLSADRGSSLIDGAAARFEIEKATDRLVDVVLLVSKNPLVNRFFLVFKPVLPRKPLRCLLLRDLKVCCETAQIRITYDDARITAAVGGTLAAVVLVLGFL